MRPQVSGLCGTSDRSPVAEQHICGRHQVTAKRKWIEDLKFCCHRILLFK